MSKTETIRVRSYAAILPEHLKILASLARNDLEAFFSRNPALAKLYRRRLLCVALCQGAALHFVDRRNGVKDFDVWTFFGEHPNRRFPWRRRITNADFGPSAFGRNPKDKGYTGRRVDFLMRAIKRDRRQNGIVAVFQYLSEAKSKSSRCLAQKAVVILEPASRRGTVIWPKAGMNPGLQHIQEHKH